MFSVKMKKQKAFSKTSCTLWKCPIPNLAVTLIALKREVAATQIAGFPWSECQVSKLTASHCTI